MLPSPLYQCSFGGGANECRHRGDVRWSSCGCVAWGRAGWRSLDGSHRSLWWWLRMCGCTSNCRPSDGLSPGPVGNLGAFSGLSRSRRCVVAIPGPLFRGSVTACRCSDCDHFGCRDVCEVRCLPVPTVLAAGRSMSEGLIRSPVRHHRQLGAWLWFVAGQCTMPASTGLGLPVSDSRRASGSHAGGPSVCTMTTQR